MKNIVCISLFLSLFASVVRAQSSDTALISRDSSTAQNPTSFVSGIAGELSEIPNAIIYPNPLTGPTIQIRFDKFVADGLAIIYIMNLNGDIEYSGQIMVQDNCAYVDLQDKHLPRGYHNVALVRGVEKVSGKFLVAE